MKSLNPDSGIYCEKCKRPVLRQHVDQVKKTAFCDGCQHTFPLKKAAARQRQETFMPPGTKNIRLTALQNELTVTVRWAGNYPFKRVLRIKPPAPLDKTDDTPAPLTFDGVGGLSGLAIDKSYVVMHYGWTFLAQAIAFFLNRTRVRVTADYVWIDHYPMDVLPTAFFQARQIEQLFVREMPPWAGSSKQQATLFLKLKNGMEFDILWDLQLDVLLYLEQEIERILGIEDRAMAEEIV